MKSFDNMHALDIAQSRSFGTDVIFVIRTMSCHTTSYNYNVHKDSRTDGTHRGYRYTDTLIISLYRSCYIGNVKHKERKLQNDALRTVAVSSWKL